MKCTANIPPKETLGKIVQHETGAVFGRRGKRTETNLLGPQEMFSEVARFRL